MFSRIKVRLVICVACLRGSMGIVDDNIVFSNSPFLLAPLPAQIWLMPLPICWVWLSISVLSDGLLLQRFSEVLVNYRWLHELKRWPAQITSSSSIASYFWRGCLPKYGQCPYRYAGRIVNLRRKRGLLSQWFNNVWWAIGRRMYFRGWISQWCLSLLTWSEPHEYLGVQMYTHYVCKTVDYLCIIHTCASNKVKKNSSKIVINREICTPHCLPTRLYLLYVQVHFYVQLGYYIAVSCMISWSNTNHID